MTLDERAEVRRARVGTKVLGFGLAIFVLLGSFWTIVWFIRSYVEQPRVTFSPAIALAARESTPVVPATPPAEPSAVATQQKAPEPVATQLPAAEATPTSAPIKTSEADQPSSTGSIADRWAPLTPAAQEPPPPPVTTEKAAAPPPAAPAEPPAEEIAESAVPAISGPAPLPRRKPLQTAAIRARPTDPPLPRPRPDGPAPQSVWTAVPSSDDRYQAGQ